MPFKTTTIKNLLPASIGLLLLFSITLPAQAQRIHAFVSAGTTFSQIEGDELKGFNQCGFTAGVGALSAISSDYRWGLSLEALFAQRGSYNKSGDPYNIGITLNYIDIPLMVHYQDPYGGMLFGLGLDYGRLVQQPHGIIRYNPNYFIPDTTDMTFLKNDLAAVADFRFTIWEGLQFNLRWQYSLIPVKRDWVFHEYVGTRLKEYVHDAHNHTVTLRLIWQF
ncbi:MAG: outer membrane beta-barrel protein [Bacteroidales bacterium]|nr:outer membrane beta-barrel protein [Bacteroidales bacterium]